MAFQNLPDLGYKDEGPLGAFFAGINGGNANIASQLANAQAAENLQQSQYDNPLNSIKLLLEANRANSMNTPDNVNAYTQGQLGDFMSRFAKGTIDRDTATSEIGFKNADNAFKTSAAGNNLRFSQGQQSALDDPTYGAVSGMSGFPMMGGMDQQQPGSIGFNMEQKATPKALFASRDWLESRGKDFNADGSVVTSNKGAKYKNQVMPATAKDPGFGIKPAASDTPEEYNRVGDELLSALYNKYGNEEMALAAYNAGHGTVDRALSAAKASGKDWRSYLPIETRKYIASSGFSNQEGAAGSPLMQPNTQQTQQVGNIPFFNQPQTNLSRMAGIMGTTPDLYKDIAKEQVKGAFDVQKGREKNKSDTALMKNETAIRGQNLAELQNIQNHVAKLEALVSKEALKQMETDAFDRLMGNYGNNPTDAQKAQAESAAKTYAEQSRDHLKKEIDRYNKYADVMRRDLHPNLYVGAEQTPDLPTQAAQPMAIDQNAVQQELARRKALKG